MIPAALTFARENWAAILLAWCLATALRSYEHHDPLGANASAHDHPSRDSDRQRGGSVHSCSNRPNEVRNHG